MVRYNHIDRGIMDCVLDVNLLEDFWSFFMFWRFEKSLVVNQFLVIYCFLVIIHILTQKNVTAAIP